MMTSAQIASLTANQNARFGNMQAFSQQISPQFAPMGGVPGQQPYSVPQHSRSFSYGYDPGAYTDPGGYAFGNRLAGGMMSGISNVAFPALAGGAMMYSSFKGGPMGMIDPFTGTIAAARSGYAAAGIGGGMAMGGVALGGYMAAGHLAHETVGGLYRGAFQQAQLGTSLNRHWQQMGTGGRGGFGFGRGGQLQIGNQLAGLEDAFTELREIHRVVDKLGNMGMFRNVQSADEFGKRMTDAIKTMKSIAKAVGSTLEEAVPLFESTRRAGIYNNADIMRNAIALRGLKAGGMQSPEQLMVQGAEFAQGLGATRGQGASLFTGLGRMLQAGVGTGSLDEKFLMELAGGQELGAGGYEAVAGRMGQRIMGSLLGRNRQMGTAMLFGALKPGTLEIDPEARRAMASGQMGVEEMMRRGFENRGKMSSQQLGRFATNMEGMLGELLSGPEGFGVSTNIAKKFADRSGHDLETFLSRIMGFSREETKLFAKIESELDTIMAKTATDREKAAEEAFYNANARMQRSWEGTKRRLMFGFRRGVGMRAESYGRRMGHVYGSMGDNLMDWITGRHDTELTHGGMEDIVRAASGGGASALLSGMTGANTTFGKGVIGGMSSDRRKALMTAVMDTIASSDSAITSFHSGDSGRQRAVMQGLYAAAGAGGGRGASQFKEVWDQINSSSGLGRKLWSSMARDLIGGMDKGITKTVETLSIEERDLRQAIESNYGLAPGDMFSGPEGEKFMQEITSMSTAKAQGWMSEFRRHKLVEGSEEKALAAMGLSGAKGKAMLMAARARDAGGATSSWFSFGQKDQDSLFVQNIQDWGRAREKLSRAEGLRQLKNQGQRFLAGLQDAGIGGALGQKLQALGTRLAEGKGGEILSMGGDFSGLLGMKLSGAQLEQLGGVGRLGVGLAEGYKLAGSLGGVTNMEQLNKALGSRMGFYSRTFGDEIKTMATGGFDAQERRRLQEMAMSGEALKASMDPGRRMMYEDLPDLVRHMKQAVDQSGFIKVVNMGDADSLMGDTLAEVRDRTKAWSAEP